MSFFMPVIEALNRASVSYVVVGGLATILHGHTRLTTDVDLVVLLERQNLLKALSAITDAGFVPRLPLNPADFADESTRRRWVQEKGLLVFSYYDARNPAFGVDVFADYPLGYDELIGDAVHKDVGGIQVRICSLEHLIQIKRAANRPVDRDDVEVLEQIRDG